MYQPHETKRITLKRADIDARMIPLIKWLNSFYSVYTLYCCEGSEDYNVGSSMPYITFVCGDNGDLEEIIDTFKKFRAINNYDTNFVSIRSEFDLMSTMGSTSKIVIYFGGEIAQEILNKFVKYIKSKDKK